MVKIADFIMVLHTTTVVGFNGPERFDNFMNGVDKILNTPYSIKCNTVWGI
jgi:hypothetical protein